MPGTIKFTPGNPYRIDSTGGALSLPLVIFNFDLIPKRVRWISPNANAGEQVVMQDVNGNTCYEEGPVTTTGAFDPVEQRPRLKEKWFGYVAPGQVVNAISGPVFNAGITLTVFPSGTLLIYV